MSVRLVSFRRGVLFVVAILISTFTYTVTADCTSVSVSIVPVDDAFVKASDPGTNYGSAGALAVSGPDATNLFAEPNGQYDTVMKIDAAAAVTAFDAAFGAGNWTLTGAELVTQEVGAPQNGIFNVGVGQFDVRWLSNDSWIQGLGSPQAPIVASGDEMCWNLLQSLLTSATEAQMGTYANQAANGQRTYSLTLVPAFVADVLAGGPVSLHLAPVTSTIGYTFIASNNGNVDNHPRIVLTAKAAGGDVNCDTLRNLTDVNAFILAALDPATFATTYPGCNIAGADLNHDGNIDGRDIPSLLCAVLP